MCVCVCVCLLFFTRAQTQNAIQRSTKKSTVRRATEPLSKLWWGFCWRKKRRENGKNTSNCKPMGMRLKSGRLSIFYQCSHNVYESLSLSLSLCVCVCVCVRACVCVCVYAARARRFLCVHVHGCTIRPRGSVCMPERMFS